MEHAGVAFARGVARKVIGWGGCEPAVVVLAAQEEGGGARIGRSRRPEADQDARLADGRIAERHGAALAAGEPGEDEAKAATMPSPTRLPPRGTWAKEAREPKVPCYTGGWVA